jgi:CheY-like chemotaxis protein
MQIQELIKQSVEDLSAVNIAVEHDLANRAPRALVANLLERSGYHVGEAASGEEALRALRGGDYPIVITDWKMPGMSGLELCRTAGADAHVFKSANLVAKM